MMIMMMMMSLCWRSD